MIRLHCKVSGALDVIIQRATVRHGNKGRALKALVKLALADGKNNRCPFKANPPFGSESEHSCTLDMAQKDYDATESYRSRYLLTKKNKFFFFALQHGAYLFHQATTAPTASGTDKPAAA
ncbi:MAG TPA: hypothetical protein VEX16_03705 [Methyloceanibacter sp.]|nr:hypothetical protein [Methyloceanibacter sp.]